MQDNPQTPERDRYIKAELIVLRLRRKFDLIGIAPKKDWIEAMMEALKNAGI